MNSSQNYTFMYKEEDIKKARWCAVLSYIPLLFLIPLIFKKDSKYARFHANQGAVLFVFEIISSGLYFILKLIAGAFSLTSLIIALNFVMTAVLILLLSIMLTGIINSNSGLAKSLPFIGFIEIIK